MALVSQVGSKLGIGQGLLELARGSLPGLLADGVEDCFEGLALGRGERAAGGQKAHHLVKHALYDVVNARRRFGVAHLGRTKHVVDVAY